MGKQKKSKNEHIKLLISNTISEVIGLRKNHSDGGPGISFSLSSIVVSKPAVKHGNRPCYSSLLPFIANFIVVSHWCLNLKNKCSYYKK